MALIQIYKAFIQIYKAFIQIYKTFHLDFMSLNLSHSLLPLPSPSSLFSTCLQSNLLETQKYSVSPLITPPPKVSFALQDEI